MALISMLTTLYTDPSLPEGAELAARIEEHELDLEQLLTLSLDDVKELGFANGLGVQGDRLNWLKLPDPTVVKQEAPIKGLLVWDELLITGNDKGELKLFNS